MRFVAYKDLGHHHMLRVHRRHNQKLLSA